MRSATHYLLWMFVFTLPWEAFAFPRISLYLGLASTAVGIVATMLSGRFRRPGVVFTCALAFWISAAASLLWTVSSAMTIARVITYAQMVGLVWMMREFGRTEEQRLSVLVALCLGLFVPLLNLLHAFTTTTLLGGGDIARYTAMGYNANDLGLTFMIGFPIAWHLALTCRRPIAILGAIYVLLAPIGTLLTGSRGSFLAGLVALGIIPLTVRMSFRSVAAIAIALIVLSVGAATVVPSVMWNRLFTVKDELAGEGTMSGRVGIWTAGFQVFEERPLLGVGAGAFLPAVEPLVGPKSPHSVLLAVLVEQGVIGFTLFIALVAACAWVISGLPLHQRQIWGVVLATWFIGGMSVGWQYRKLTWFLFALIAAQEGAERFMARARKAQPALSSTAPTSQVPREWHRPATAR